MSRNETTQVLAFLSAVCGVLSALFFGVVVYVALLAIGG